MAIYGVTESFIGEYLSGDFGGGRTMGHMVEYSLDIETQEETPFYGDGLIIETDGVAVFKNGTLTVSTTDISEENLQWLFNLDSETVDGKTHYFYNDNTKPRTIGFGIIETHQVDDEKKFKAIILPRCTPRIPGAAAASRGERIEWQNEEIEFNVERSELSGHPWKYDAWFDDEQDARYFLRYQLGFFGFQPIIGIGQIGYMTVE